MATEIKFANDQLLILQKGEEDGEIEKKLFERRRNKRLVDIER